MTPEDKSPFKGILPTLSVQPSSDPSKGFEAELFTISLPAFAGQVDVVVSVKSSEKNSLELLIFIMSLQVMLSKFHPK